MHSFHKEIKEIANSEDAYEGWKIEVAFFNSPEYWYVSFCRKLNPFNIEFAIDLNENSTSADIYTRDSICYLRLQDVQFNEGDSLKSVLRLANDVIRSYLETAVQKFTNK